MALLFVDGFNHYSVPTDKWDVLFDNANVRPDLMGRFSQGLLSVGGSFGSYMGKNITTSSSKITWGAAHKFLADSDSFWELRAGGAELFSLITRGGTGTITVRRGEYNIGTVLASSAAAAITGNTWQYIECQVLLSNSVGTVVVKVDGVEVINISGVDTTDGATVPDSIVCGASNGQVAGRAGYWDDFYVLDDSGAENNDFLGDVKVVTLRPKAAGTHTDFTPNGVLDNWDTQNEVIIDDDTTFVRSGDISARDTYEMEELLEVTGTVGTVFGVQTTIGARKTDAGQLTYNNTLVSGGVEYDSVAFQSSNDYKFTMDMFNTNPNGGTPWTQGTVDTAEVGFRLDSKEV